MNAEPLNLVKRRFGPAGRPAPRASALKARRLNGEPLTFPAWLCEWMTSAHVYLWGAADLRTFSTPRDRTGRQLPFAVSWAMPMPPEVMAGVRNGPTDAYAAAYARINRNINEVSERLAEKIREGRFRALALAASERSDKIAIRGDFPHKTAATRAGLGWIGRHCQLITRPFGPWVRLGTVFTDMPMPCGASIDRSFCGRCMLCVSACPAGALTGNAWTAGMPREALLDAGACDRWKKAHYFRFHRGHNCGICAAVCPYGVKFMKRTPIFDPTEHPNAPGK